MLTTPRYRVPPDPDQLLAAFPQRLKALRTARHLSLHELAQRAGVTKAFLSLLERGVNAPSAASLEALAAALNVPVSALFPDEAATPLRVSFVRQAERVAERGHAYTCLLYTSDAA
ncbi:MAG: helix-turn-helix domain-containing protein, partial [bacterium]|nr:helix-turn-helix domain-containing protein [bacterium]